MSKASKLMIQGEAASKEMMAGAKMMYDAVSRTYGPKGRNVIVEKNFGYPMLTRDGVTVSREVYTKDAPKNLAAQLLNQASEETNRIAGDGTSASVILAYHLMKNGYQAIAGGLHPMDVKDQILADARLLQDRLPSLSKEVRPSTDKRMGQLQEVATVSSGDPLLGQLIAEAVEYVGPDGGINVEKALVNSIERDYIEGYYLQSGFEALAISRKETSNPIVVVVQKRITSHSDAIMLLNNIVSALQKEAEKQNRQHQMPGLVLVGNIEEQAYHSIVQLVGNGQLDAILLKTPPSFGDMAKRLLEDIAIYAGCDAITETTNLRDVTLDHIGRNVERIVATKTDATLYGSNESETVQDRIKELKDLIANEQVDAINERLRDRLAKLEGKVALFRIGGATTFGKEEVEFRVEDAILATRAAARHGVVAGGGITLLELSKTPGVSDITCNALQAVFQQLLINANLPAEIKLAEALTAKPGYGFNLRKDAELVDLVAAGILDPTLVVEQVIRNACEMAANILSSDLMLVREEEDKKD